MQLPGPPFISICVQMGPENYGYALRKAAHALIDGAPLLQSRPQNPVDEAGRVGTAVLLGELDSLVDRHLHRDVFAVEGLIERRPQDAALQRRDARQRPVLECRAISSSSSGAVASTRSASSRVNGLASPSNSPRGLPVTSC